MSVMEEPDALAQPHKQTQTAPVSAAKLQQSWLHWDDGYSTT